MPFRLRIPRKLCDQIVAQAFAELPNECCGLLGGRILPSERPETDVQVGEVLCCYPLVNAAASPVEYLSDAHGMFAAMRDMRRREIDVLAVYHSHPTSAPRPSRTDLERNYSEEVVNLIISLQSREPEMRGWWLTANEFREAEWECIEREPTAEIAESAEKE